MCAIAILGIIAVAFTNSFVFSNSSIFTTGEKNKAMSVAASKLELLYARDPKTLTPAELESLIGGTNIAWGSPQLYEYTPGTVVKFSYRSSTPVSGSDGYIFNIVVFYLGGREHAILTSFIKGGA